jgi:hypothetical protein
VPLWNDRTPLSEDAWSALHRLADATSPGEGFGRSRAEDILTEEYEAMTASAILDQLLNRGYLYSVDGQLFITEREELE